MKRFVECEDRRQGVLLPEYLNDYVCENNPVRVVDLFVDELDLLSLGFEGAAPAATGRPGYHPGVLLKLYIYGYLNQVSSSRRLEREAQRNVEVMWLTGRLAPDFKTIADFRRDNGPAIRATCRQFVMLCRQLDLFADAIVAIDGSKFKAVNTRDKNFTRASIKRRMEQVDASIDRYLSALATADRHDGEVAQQKSVRLKDKLASLREQMRAFQALEVEVHAAPDQQISLTDPDARAMATNGKGTGMVGYNVRTVVDAIDAMQARMDRAPKIMRVRRATVEHPFGTLKAWMGATHFRMRALEKVKTEMNLHVLAYNLKRAIQILGVAPLMDVIRA